MNWKHGHTSNGRVSPEYTTWLNMLQRCYLPSTNAYELYGGSGIVVCSKWRVFENFLADMGCKPTPSHTIDRIDNNGHYEPSNCRWATRKEQRRNQRPMTLCRKGLHNLSETRVSWGNEHRCRECRNANQRARYKTRKMDL